MEIEEVAKANPNAILREIIQPVVGLQPYQARKLAFGMGLPIEAVNNAVPFLLAIYKAFIDTDASMLEINPCVLTGDNKLVALDAKMTIDDNALFRHKELRELRDLDEEDPLEVEASKYGLNYIKLDGNVACMVNGAGLAMATMDIIKYAGGSPANFLDVGGGASAEQVKNAFRNFDGRSRRESRLHQYFRRHSALRCSGYRSRRGRQRPAIESAGRRAYGRNKRGAGPENSAR